MKRNTLFRWGVTACASVIPLVLLAILVFLLLDSWPALRFNGWHFLVSNQWNLGNEYGDLVTVNGQEVPPGADYGIGFLIVGTLLSSFLALLLALPVSVAASAFLAEVVPKRLQNSAALMVELLAGVPSVVFGLWGLIVLVPFMNHYIYPGLTKVLGDVPFFQPPTGAGYGLLTSSVVLAVMIAPLIASTVRGAIENVPMVQREAGLALGATRFEVLWKTVIPSVRRVIIGAGILALGRALGETMAVLMVSGNALGYLPHNIYSPISTMASFIVSQLDSAMQDASGMAEHALAEIALILFFITLIVNVAARGLLWLARE